MRNLYILILFSLACRFQCAGQASIISSPGKKIIFSLSIENGRPYYAVSYYGKKIVDKSALDLKLDDAGPLRNCKQIKPPLFSSGTELYNLAVGKTSDVKQPFSKMTVFLKGAAHNINIEVKVFNDAVAFRYVFPLQKRKTAFAVLEEATEFNITGNPITKALLLPDFNTSHEGLYTTAPLGEIKNDTLIDVPALFQTPNKIFVAVTEAALLNYAGMYLIKKNGMLQSQLSPLPGQQAIKVKALFPHASPWRVILISNRMGALMETNTITSLCPPQAIKNTNWLKPGTTTFPWWYGTIVPDSIKGGNNFETNKYYIDFCAANNIKYHTVVEYGGHEWYTNDGEWYQPGKNFDIIKPVEGLNMQQICDYAKSKGVGIRVWTHWKALYPKLDTAFALFQQWGIKGMMVDFMDRDDQEMVNIQTEILQKAAKRRLHIQFHGAYKPTGLSRTYPNEFTREGAMNYEYNKWEKKVTPDADLDIVFTRMLAGPVDYHQGGFRALPVEKFITQSNRPYVMGTRCHMLAMYVVLENYQGMVCDEPDAYRGQPGFEVLQKIPVTWDETKVLDAVPGSHVTIARRKGGTWYIGSITGNRQNEAEISFDFLKAGNYSAVMYRDDVNNLDDANRLIKESKIVNSSTKTKIVMASGGGNLIIVSK